MIALEFLKLLRDEVYCVPRSKEGARVALPSNSELVRWCKNGAMRLNGVSVAFSDTISFPVTDLVFFPKNRKQRCTLQ